MTHFNEGAPDRKAKDLVLQILTNLFDEALVDGLEWEDRLEEEEIFVQINPSTPPIPKPGPWKKSFTVRVTYRR